MTQSRSQTEIDRVREEAATWLVRLDAGDASDEEIERFHAWSTSSALHRSALRELAQTSAEFEALGVLARETGLRLPEALTVSSVRARSSAPRIFARPWWKPHRMAVAAMLIIAVAAGVLRLAVPSGQEYATAVGQRREVALGDGSVVSLNSNSRIHVEYDSGRRRVDLESGEALFKVAHDVDRPFIVHSGPGTVRALGTSFNVRARGPEVTVTVLTGTVLVTPDAGAGPGTSATHATVPTYELVRAGERLAYGRALGSVVKVSGTELMHATAWREGKLYVDDQRLDEVIEEIQPYTKRRIVIADGSLQGLRVGGVFKVDDIDDVLGMLEQALPITVVNASGELVMLLERRDAGDGAASGSPHRPRGDERG